MFLKQAFFKLKKGSPKVQNTLFKCPGNLFGTLCYIFTSLNMEHGDFITIYDGLKNRLYSVGQ